MRRAKVLFIVPSLLRAGAQMQVVNLVNGLDKDSIEPHLLYYAGGDDLLPIVDVRAVRLHRLQRRGRADLRLIGAVSRLIDEHAFDVVHCTLMASLFTAWAARARATAKPPLICAVHTTINRGHREELAERLVYRWLLPACADVIFVCETQRRYWLDKYPRLGRRSHVVFNGVDAEAFAPVCPARRAETRATLGIAPDAKVVLCIAGFRPEKRHELLIAAFAQAAAREPRAMLVLVGEGETRAGAQRLATHLGLARRVVFLGQSNDVRGLLGASDFTVLASTAVETFSMAMLESMAMGVPLVATDVGGTGEAVRDGETGLLVPPGDVAALARGLARMFGDEPLRAALGANARRLVLEKFSRRRMVRETAELLGAAARAADG